MVIYKTVIKNMQYTENREIHKSHIIKYITVIKSRLLSKKEA